MIFSGKTVVITGAGSGIGRAFAQGFCADGADVVGIGRTRASLEETASACNGRMSYVVGDIGRGESVDELFAHATRRHGKVDILVNNAAVYPKVGFLACSHEEWRDAINVNVIGMAHCCRAALPGMLERGYGRIVNLGSFAWRGPIPNSSAYSVSKGAVGPLTKALAVEIDRQRYPDVLINELIPGVVRTGMSDDGEDPRAIYPHLSYVASLPSSGPTGKTFLQSALYVEHRGLRSRLMHFLRKAVRRSGEAR